MSDAHAAPPADAAAAAPAPSGGKGKMKLLIILSAAMIGEAVLFFFLGFGGGGSTPAAAEDQPEEHAEATEHGGGHAAPAPAASGHGGGHGGGHGEAKPASNAAFVEVELDAYNVTNRQAAADVTLQVQFKLVAIVANDQQSAFETVAKTEQKARVRETVEKLVRKASLEDLYDPSLGVIKRMVREEINRVLRQTFVTDIILSEYKTMER